jgi:hypothetical protein
MYWPMQVRPLAWRAEIGHFQSFGQCAKICLDRTFKGVSVWSRDLEYRLPFLFVPPPDGAASRESEGRSRDVAGAQRGVTFLRYCLQAQSPGAGERNSVPSSAPRGWTRSRRSHGNH